ncbi:MAG: hypothetical protein IJO01_02445 [Oscillospiraceae bacterium]|nr:hypothetical protein [Oscillospiraceae bacterium]
MKKVFAVMIFAVFVQCLGCAAFAAENSTNIGEKYFAEIEVSAAWSFAEKTPAVYGIDIAWSNMTFVYSGEETKLWDPKTHTYDVESKGEWKEFSAEITVTNHSNISVSVEMEYVPEDKTCITGSLSKNFAVLEAGKEGDYAGADFVTATLYISGNPSSSDYFGGEKIGTVKIIVK